MSEQGPINGAIVNPAEASQGIKLDPYTFVPFVEQEGPNKIHRILLSLNQLGIQTSEQPAEELRFGWGDTERLEIVVSNVPVVAAETGTLYDPTASFLIRQRGREIRDYLELHRPKDREAVEVFLPPTDIKKIDDLIQTLGI